MTPDFALILILGLGEADFRNDAYMETPAKIAIDVQLFKGRSTSVHFTFDHQSDITTTQDYG